MTQFPQSIDTVESSGIRKTVLLSTSATSRILKTPAKVEWASVRNEEDLRLFNKSSIPVAVLLEGQFKSLFANRITAAQSDSMIVAGQPFLAATPQENKMLVIADGDIFTNTGTQAEGPLPMGMNAYSKKQYANREFLLNSLEYMLDPSGIMETRSKDFTLRLLDPALVDQQKKTWQIIAFILPIGLIILVGIAFQYWRKRVYARKIGLQG